MLDLEALGWWVSLLLLLSLPLLWRLAQRQVKIDPEKIDLEDVAQTQTAFTDLEARAIAAEQQQAKLQQQCLHLRDTLQQQKTQLTEDFQDAAFAHLQTLLTSYPSACQMADAKPDLPARNLVALFTPLENLLQSWEIEPIGVAWETVSYDPQLHQPDDADFQVGESVYIRFVGYRQRDRILVPAKVSRTLPLQPGERE
jgi:molecular chaperone GrpE (heat shock protein)